MLRLRFMTRLITALFIVTLFSLLVVLLTPDNINEWFAVAKPYLQIWRFCLYGVILFIWFKKNRPRLLQNHSRPGVIRLDRMIILFILLMEATVHYKRLF